LNIGERIKKIIGIEGSVKDTLLPMISYNAFSAGTAAGSQLNNYNAMFISRIEGVSPGYVGLRSLLGGLVDAFIDPFLGMMADRTRSRWGRHRPYLMIGAIPWAILFFMGWYSFGLSGGDNPMRVVWYYIAVSMTMAAVSSFSNVPYVAMLPELAPDYFQRTQFISVGYIMNGVTMPATHFMMLAMIGTTPFAEVPRDTWRFMGMVVALIAILPMFATAIFTKTKSSKDMEKPEMDLRFIVSEYRQVFRNRAFVQFFKMRYFLLFGMGFFGSGIARNFFVETTADAPGYLIIIGTWIGISEMMAFLPNYFLTKKVGKQQMVWFTAPFLFLSFILVLFIRPGMLPLLFIQEMLSPFGSSGISWAIQNIQPDVTDVDEMITGRRREGAMTAVDNLIRTSTAAVLGYIIGVTLEFFGVEGGVPGAPGQSMFNARAAHYVGPFFGSPNAGMRLVRGVLPIFFVGAAMLTLRRFTMTKADHKLIQELIAEKHANGAVDPTDEQKARLEEIAGQKWDDMWIGQAVEVAVKA